MKGPLTAEEAANELGYHRDHLYRLLKSAVVKGEQFNRVWMIDPPRWNASRPYKGQAEGCPKHPNKRSIDLPWELGEATR